jgi:hypothetical protein
MPVERERLEQERLHHAPWKQWGPYLSERQWGTVREDYSDSGDAWNYFTHDQARSRAYRWGEDGLAGISDNKQRLCFALALWNGKDPILKERLFGLTNSEGNHGEDVKEYYFYLDSTPTHSYMKYLYKYPQSAYPYADLVDTNGRRTRNDFEYELLDTGIFDGDRYFDVFVEYAKATPNDILIKITAWNRGPEAAELQLLPTLWFRNDWSSWITRPAAKPSSNRSKRRQVQQPWRRSIANSASSGLRRMCSKVVSSALTTSGFSIGAHLCPPEATWSRHTVQHGWHSSARTWRSWQLNSSPKTTPLRIWSSSSSKTSSTLRPRCTGPATTECGTRRTASTTRSTN